MNGLPDSPESEGVPIACVRCGTSYQGRYCPTCGWPRDVPLPAQTSAWRTVLGVIWLFATILFVVYLAAMLGALVWVGPSIIEGIVGGACPSCTILVFWINPLNPTFLDVVELRGLGMLTWFLIVMALILGIYLWLLLFHGRRTYRDIRLPPEQVDRKLRSRSAVVTVGQVFMAVLFFDFLYHRVILPFGFGFEPDVPSFFSEAPEWLVVYSVVNAVVVEEFATRLLLIGLPMALAAFVNRLPHVIYGTRGKDLGNARYLAGAFKYLVGGQVREGSPRAILFVGGALVLASAAIFGYLHVPVWGAWKFVDTFLAGLALGYLFLRHGILAAMLLHLSVNSLGILLGVAGLFLFAILYFALVAVGTGFFAYYAKRTGDILFGWITRRGRRPAPTPLQQSAPPAHTSDDPRGDLLLFAVVCPECGGREAQYQDGVLVCSRCGTSLSSPPADRSRGQLLD